MSEGPLFIIGGHEDKEGKRRILKAIAREARGRRLVIATIASISLKADTIDAVVARFIEEAERSPDKAALFGAKAKLYATECAVEIAHEALQVAGGHGFFGTSGIDRHLRDAYGLTVHLGHSALLREEIGRSAFSV